MADRVVKVTLSAQVAEYKKGMQEAAQATRTAGTEAEKLTQQRQAFELMGRTMLVAGGVMAAGLGLAVAKFADFDQAMSNVLATGEDARANQDALREAALEAGAATVFSATESANAIEEMAKAGVDAKDILGGGLAGALDLAAAGGLGVADAAGIAATALKVFNLEGSDMSHVADLLAAGAGKAMGDVTDLSAALAQGGQVAAATGLSIEETTATLAAFASQGLLGSDAGTSFKTMLQRLTPQSAEAREMMEELGISAYDASGQFIGMAEFAGNLQGALKDLTPEQRNAALSVMFGSDAVRAANVLLSEGEDGIRKWTAAVDDQGYAAETAATRLDNMKGDLEALGGAIDSAMISMGEAADGPGRFFIQMLTEMVDGFNGMPAGGQQAVFWVGAVGAAATIAGGAFFTAIPKLVEYRTAVETLGPGAQRAARGLGMVARVGGGMLAGLGLGITAAELLTAALDNIGPSADEVQNRIKTATNAADIFNTSIESMWVNFGQGDAAKAAQQVDNLAGALDRLSGGKRDGTLIDANTITSVQVIGAELATLAKADLPAAQRQFRLLAEAAGLTEKQQSQLLDTMEPYRDALVKQASDQDIAADSSELLALALGESEVATSDQADALEVLQGVAVDTETEVNSLADAIRNFGSAQFDVEQATIDFHGAVADLDAILNEGAGSLDVTTEAGRNTHSAMLDVAQSTNDYAGSVAAMGGSTEEVQGILEAGRQKIIDTRTALGDTREEAEAYADQLISTPETIATQVHLNGIDAADAAIRAFKNRWDGLSIGAYLNTDLSRTGPLKLPNSANGNLFNYEAFSDGGFASGIYAGRAGGIQKFAEPETGWEAFISGKPDARDRNIGIAYAALDRLGASPQAASVVIEGARITGSLDLGNGLVGVIDGRIADAKYKSAVKLSGGGVSA